MSSIFELYIPPLSRLRLRHAHWRAPVHARACARARAYARASIRAVLAPRVAHIIVQVNQVHDIRDLVNVPGG